MDFNIFSYSFVKKTLFYEHHFVFRLLLCIYNLRQVQKKEFNYFIFTRNFSFKLNNVNKNFQYEFPLCIVYRMKCEKSCLLNYLKIFIFYVAYFPLSSLSYI